MRNEERLRIGTRAVAVSNLEKVLYPARKFSKGQVIDYYLRIAPLLLPHFSDRPVTLKRFPDGIYGDAFYEKDAPGFTPDWVQTFPVPRRDPKMPPIRYVLINDAATLAWAANAGCLELHPFLHRAPEIDRPTFVAFDLDPGEGTSILESAEVAFLLRDLLAKVKLKCFPKVSGSKGIQIYMPLNVTVSYDVTQPFARALAELMVREYPDRVVVDMAKSLRAGKVFIDWSQNADHKTTIGVYSLRAKSERPYVSLPVRWQELRAAIRTSKPDRLYWTADEALRRVKRVGDLFAPVLKLKQHLPTQFMEQAAAKRPRALTQYDAKRNFSRTTEPTGAPIVRRSAQGSRRRFVVQKHAASHLHYDLRLEMHDILKSWAVPKGMPLEEGAAASAFATEDHPIEYLEFEGIIPEGQYGAGTVMVWDIGTYEILEGNYWKGHLSVFLNGTKLTGAWTLERSGEETGKTRWRLRKAHGKRRRISSKKLERSALSNKTIEEIAQAADAVWDSTREASQASRVSAVGGTKTQQPRIQAPQFVSPMKATSVQELPTGNEWLYEIKWDGYRALAAKHGDSVRLLSLKNKDLSRDFPAVVDAVHGVAAVAALIDGEIVAIDKRGCPSFQMLQNRAALGQDWQIVYYAFDLLELDGEDLKNRPLIERKARLQQVLSGSEVRYNAALPGSPETVVHTVSEAGLEGVIAKRRDSIYRGRTRSIDWLKLKLEQSQEFVIGGYNPTPGSVQSLLVGYYETGKLMFAGKVRQGLDRASRAALLNTMDPLVTARCPFRNVPTSQKSHFGEGITAEDMKKLRWLKPKLIAQVRFTEWTSYGLLRHATFVALRDDKDPAEITREHL